MNFSIEIEIHNSTKIEIDKFTISTKKVNFLFGESGIGKTLISKSLLGLLPDEKFNITINGENYSEYLSNLGVREMISKSFYVFQEPSVHLSPVEKIEEQLEKGKIINSPETDLILKNLFHEKSKKEIDDILSIYPKPFRPSGGEKQRILNTMAFMAIDNLSFSNAWNTLFVFDEPTGHLDTMMRNRLLDEIFRLFVKDKPTILFITHDYSIIGYLTKRFAKLNEFIEYSEIYRNNGKLKQRDFNPDKYLSWIKTEKPFKGKSAEKFFVLKSGVKVFGRKIEFFKDNLYKEKTDLVLREGEIIYLKAPSGAGKTTVAKVILGIIKAEFLIKIDEIDLNSKTPFEFYIKNIYGKKITMAFQHADEALNPELKVKEVFESIPNFDKEKIKSEFEVVFSHPFEKFSERKIKNLSGGEKQKINLLRALFLNAKLTILDEPLYGMDLDGVKSVIKLLRKKIDEGQAFIIISHNEDIFCRIIERKIFLKSKLK